MLPTEIGFFRYLKAESGYTVPAYANTAGLKRACIAIFFFNIIELKQFNVFRLFQFYREF